MGEHRYRLERWKCVCVQLGPCWGWGCRTAGGALVIGGEVRREDTRIGSGRDEVGREEGGQGGAIGTPCSISCFRVIDQHTMKCLHQPFSLSHEICMAKGNVTDYLSNMLVFSQHMYRTMPKIPVLTL